jgi:hypothetical protein
MKYQSLLRRGSSIVRERSISFIRGGRPSQPDQRYRENDQPGGADTRQKIGSDLTVQAIRR